MKNAARFRPEPFELLALVSFVAAVAMLKLAGLRVTLRTLEYMVREVGSRLLVALAVGAALNLLYRCRSREPRLAYLRSLRSPSWLLDTLRVWIASVLVIYAYSWLKVSIPLLNEHVWDAELARIDHALHGGLSPSRFLVAFFEGTPLLRFIDWFYALWVPLTVTSFAFFAMSLSPRARAQFVFSHVTLWTLGVWLYIAVPAVGPGLAFPQEWTSVRSELPRSAAAQVALTQNYRRVVESRSTGVLRAGFNPSYGVAAMPSLHVGVVWLLVLWSRLRARPLYAFFVATLILTFLGSVATGWHYAVDGYVGIAAAQLSYWASRRVSLGLPDPEPAATRGPA